jgi:hypothetical protein
VLLMAQMVIAPPSTAMANAKASKNFVIMMLPRFDPRDLRLNLARPGLRR